VTIVRDNVGGMRRPLVPTGLRLQPMELQVSLAMHDRFEPFVSILPCPRVVNTGQPLT
jgi:hypothetical protein